MQQSIKHNNLCEAKRINKLKAKSKYSNNNHKVASPIQIIRSPKTTPKLPTATILKEEESVSTKDHKF